MRAKIKATGEMVEGRLWKETDHFKAWPPDERVWPASEVEIFL